MSLRAVHSVSLSDQVFKQLAAAILAGTYPAGENLPSERKLVETFAVNRHVVREALKRLSQAGLLKISQGGGARVLDFREHAGLDLLTLMAEHSEFNAEAMGIWLSVHQMRSAIASDAARLCARKGSSPLKAELLDVAQLLSTTQDADELFRLERRFWMLVVSGADNLAYRLAFNTMIKGASAKSVYGLTKALLVNELAHDGFRRPVAEAIAQGDGDMAEQRTRSSMRWVIETLEAQVERAGRVTASAHRATEQTSAARDESRVVPVQGEIRSKSEHST